MYIEHFELTDEPFGVTPDPAYVYLGPEHREALAALHYGLLERRGFVTLVGEVGTGKTTLLYTLLSRLDGDVQAAYVAYTKQGFEDLLAGVLSDLGVTVRSSTKRDLLEALNRHLVQQAERGVTVALVIDEAQNLSDEAFEELRLLSNFETYERKLLQIVLVGQPELQERLARTGLRQLRDRVAVHAQIGPLGDEESVRYIEHRLLRAGGTLAAVMTPSAVRAIVRGAEGIPRRINILCHNALLFASSQDQRRVSGKIAQEVVSEMRRHLPAEPTESEVAPLRLRVGLGRMAASAAALVLVVLGSIALASRFPYGDGVFGPKGDDRPSASTADDELAKDAAAEDDSGAAEDLGNLIAAAMVVEEPAPPAEVADRAPAHADSPDAERGLWEEPPGSTEAEGDSGESLEEEKAIAELEPQRGDTPAEASGSGPAPTEVEDEALVAGPVLVAKAALVEREPEGRRRLFDSREIMGPTGSDVSAAPEAKASTAQRTQAQPGIHRLVEIGGLPRWSPTERPDVVIARVPEGATVMSLGRELYAGSDFSAGQYLARVRELNPGVPNLDYVVPGQVVRLPTPPERPSEARKGRDGS